MYYDHPEDPAAYRVRNEYAFGDRLLVAPITTPADRATRLGAVRAWLPPGRWTDVFTGLVYRGGTTITLHRDLETIPVLAPAGRDPAAGGRRGAGLRHGQPGGAGAAGVRGRGRGVRPRRGPRRRAVGETRFTFAGGEVRIHPVEGDASAPSRRCAATTSCCAGSPAVTARRGGRFGASTVAGAGTGERRDRACRPWPRTRARCCGSAATSRRPGNRDVPERLFALLDAAQTSICRQRIGVTGC